MDSKNRTADDPSGRAGVVLFQQAEVGAWAPPPDTRRPLAALPWRPAPERAVLPTRQALRGEGPCACEGLGHPPALPPRD
jgi:hypothetical protein